MLTNRHAGSDRHIKQAGRQTAERQKGRPTDKHADRRQTKTIFTVKIKRLFRSSTGYELANLVVNV